jgi:hypothetical protein
LKASLFFSSPGISFNPSILFVFKYHCPSLPEA